MPPQRQKHISQKVGMVVTVPGAASAAAWAMLTSGCHWVATVARRARRMTDGQEAPSGQRCHGQAFQKIARLAAKKWARAWP
jgi:shikimate 5-dehydrogenase